MKKLICLFIVFSCFTAKAQVIADSTITDTLIVIEKNVIIFKDSRLDILDKRPILLARAEAATEPAPKKIPLFNPIVSSDGKTKVTGSIYASKGFRIVIYNGSERTKALEIKNKFSRAYPDVMSYMSYISPSYKIRVGNFEDRKTASNFMRKISATFPSCFIVPDIVTIKDINVK